MTRHPRPRPLNDRPLSNRPLALATAVLAGTATAATFAPAAHAAETVPPRVTVTLGQAANDWGWHRAPVSVRLHASDASGIDAQSSSVTLTGAQTGTFELVDGSFETTVATEGETVLHWQVLDQEGNQRSGSLPIRLDTVAPTGQILGGTQFLDQGEVAPIEASCTDAGSGLIEGGCTITSGYLFVSESGFAKKVNTNWVEDVAVRATVVDRAGNETVLTRTYSVVPAGARPGVDLVSTTPPGPQGWYHGPVDLVAEAHPGDPRLHLTGLTRSVDGASVTTDGASDAFRVAGDGRHEVRVRAFDVGGRTGDAQLAVAIDSVPPTVVLDVPATVVVGATVVPQVGCHDVTSLVAACEVVSGPVDTSTPGRVVVRALARDHAGLTATVGKTVEVRAAATPGVVRGRSTTTASYVVRGRTVTATVRVRGPEAATGRVVLRDGRRVVGSGRLTARGTVRITTGRLRPGVHRLTATYAGSAALLASTTRPRTVRIR